MDTSFTRRETLLGASGVAGLILLGFSAQAGARKAQANRLTMYKSPTCGCCVKWAEAAQAAGFEVTVMPTKHIQAVKAQFGVPDELASCHTSTIDGYVVEGHVPLDSVKRLISQRPNIKGIAVPGMPLGSPGMETADGSKEPFQVMAFGGPGKIRPF